MGRMKRGKGKKKRGGGNKKSSRQPASCEDSEGSGVNGNSQPGYVPADIDTPPRFGIGTRVEVMCKREEGIVCNIGMVTGHWKRSDDWPEDLVAPYLIRLDNGHPVFVLSDTEESIRESDAPRRELRFKLGDRVSCKVGDNDDDWSDGTIIKLWYTNAMAFAEDHVMPYQVQLDTGNQIYAPVDVEEFIVRATSPPPECWICFDNELSESNLIVRECACRGGSNGFVHINCLVKMAKTKVEDLRIQGKDVNPDDGVHPCHQCITCYQPFGGGSHCRAALAKVFYETYKDRDISDFWNKEATTKYARVLARDGRHGEALHLLRERIYRLRFAIEQGLIVREDVTQWKQDLANFLFDLAVVYEGIGSLPEMKTALDEALSIIDSCGGFRPDINATALQLMAKYAYESGDKNGALAYFNEASSLMKMIGGEDDASTLLSHGNLNLECGNKELGLEQLSQGVQRWTRVYGKDHSTARIANEYIQEIERGSMDKMPSRGLTVTL
ncbi:hypothetical protein ACHAXT_000052 [Thalassiosira profunda]